MANRSGKNGGGKSALQHEPSPSEIESGCKAIREKWSEEEKLRRRGMPVRGRQPGCDYLSPWQEEWTPPIVHDYDLSLDDEGERFYLGES